MQLCHFHPILRRRLQIVVKIRSCAAQFPFQRLLHLVLRITPALDVTFIVVQQSGRCIAGEQRTEGGFDDGFDVGAIDKAPELGGAV